MMVAVFIWHSNLLESKKDLHLIDAKFTKFVAAIGQEREVGLEAELN